MYLKPIVLHDVGVFKNFSKMGKKEGSTHVVLIFWYFWGKFFCLFDFGHLFLSIFEKPKIFCPKTGLL